MIFGQRKCLRNSKKLDSLLVTFKILSISKQPTFYELVLQRKKIRFDLIFGRQKCLRNSKKLDSLIVTFKILSISKQPTFYELVLQRKKIRFDLIFGRRKCRWRIHPSSLPGCSAQLLGSLGLKKKLMSAPYIMGK